MAIRTPDQRVRVFVSSTLEELADERRAVRDAIEALHLTPVMFEQGARPHPPRALYRAYMEQSDVFIGLYWQRYGWVAPGEKTSGLEDEYGLSGDRPKLIYIKAPAPHREPRLAKFLTGIKIDDRASYRRFDSADELRGLVADDLAVLLSEHFGAVGTQDLGRSLLNIDERPLPRPLTPLIGREADVDRVANLLNDPSVRLVTVVGPGGVGKTRLALAVAERMREAYADGVFFVPLTALAEPRLLIPTVARALGIAEDVPGGTGLSLRQALASAHCLIMLDNLEQLTEAAPDLAALIAATQRVQMVATSRSVLNVSGEHVFNLGPLELPSERDTHTSAVKLFLARIADSRPDFVPSSEDQAAIEELTRRLDGLPLAIELAAAQLRVLTPRGLLERMGYRRLETLKAGPRDLPTRQQALRDTIAWSYELLRRGERALFERLAVFVGSADLEAIEAIANSRRDLDIVGLLGSLVEASLVQTTEDAGEMRFGMLETIREFANERLEAGGRGEEFRKRHADHYLALATEGSQGLRGSGQLRWLDRFDREDDNFRAVFRRAIRQGKADNGARLGLLLLWFWLMRSRYVEGRSWMEATRAIPGATRHDRATAWTVDAMLAVWQGNFDLVERGVDEAIESLRDAGDTRTLGLALLLKLSEGPAKLGRRSTREAAKEAAGLLGADGDAFLQGIALLGRSFVARRVGGLDEAAALAEQALVLSSSVRDSFIRSSASTLLATTALERGALPDVRAHALEALNAASALRNHSSSALALELLAAAELRDGRLERAGRLYAVADRAYGLSRAQPWRPDALGQSMERLREALGSRLDAMVVDARGLDLDAAITELMRSEPVA